MTIAELVAYPLAGPRLPGEVLEWLLRQLPEPLRTPGVSPLTITCDSSEVLEADPGPVGRDRADAPVHVRRRAATAGGWSCCPVAGETLEGRYGAAWLGGRTLSAPARAFLDLLVEDDAALCLEEDGCAGGGQVVYRVADDS